jgi:cytochrome P450
LLSRNPDAQRKLQEEADNLLGRPLKRHNYSADKLNNLLGDDFVRKFPYANAVIQETNRLLPVVSLLDGKTINDIVIDNCYIPKGTTLFVMTRVAAFRACPTPDPFQFKPERWLDSTPEQRRLHEKLSWGFVSILMPNHSRISAIDTFFLSGLGWWSKNLPWAALG